MKNEFYYPFRQETVQSELESLLHSYLKEINEIKNQAAGLEKILE